MTYNYERGHFYHNIDDFNHDVNNFVSGCKNEKVTETKNIYQINDPNHPRSNDDIVLPHYAIFGDSEFDENVELLGKDGESIVNDMNEMIINIISEIGIDVSNLKMGEIYKIYENEMLIVAIDTINLKKKYPRFYINISRKSDKMLHQYMFSIEKDMDTKKENKNKINGIKNMIKKISKYPNYTIDDLDPFNDNLLLEKFCVHSTPQLYFRKALICFLEFPNKLYLNYKFDDSMYGGVPWNDDYYLELENNEENYNNLIDHILNPNLNL